MSRRTRFCPRPTISPSRTAIAPMGTSPASAAACASVRASRICAMSAFMSCAGLGSGLNPPPEDADDLLQLTRIARSFEAFAGDGAGQPASAPCVEAQLLRAGVNGRGSGEVDGQQPAGFFDGRRIVERLGTFKRLKAHALAMLPYAIALLLVPVIQPLQIIRRHRRAPRYTGCCCVMQCSAPSPQIKSPQWIPVTLRSGKISASKFWALRSFGSLKVGTSTRPLAM